MKYICIKCGNSVEIETQKQLRLFGVFIFFFAFEYKKEYSKND